jgi:hypothetical protein
LAAIAFCAALRNAASALAGLWAWLLALQASSAATARTDARIECDIVGVNICVAAV